MSNSLAVARVSAAGQAMPLEAARQRGQTMRRKLHALEDRYVKDWSQRIDLEVKTKEVMGHHLSQAQLQVHKNKEQFRTKNERWAMRAEAAHQWRQFTAQRKFDRCASAAALYDQRMKDFDAWRDSVMEAPRKEFEKTYDWLASQKGYSQVDIDRYYKQRLG
mmetsp:Transcript_88648/g.141119  ORF Transcript_88648/g.141119 Transcript_88648/m.141119 type:complete len:162 (-) Transcript_88648:72-557(-)